MGFTYAPSDSVYWQQGHSTETDFIYVTTQTLDQAQLRRPVSERSESDNRKPPHLLLGVFAAKPRPSPI